MTRKGSANMWWIIIAAVLAIVVMIVLLGIFTKGTTRGNEALFSCESKENARCVPVGTCEGRVVNAFDCNDEQNPVCCFENEES